MARDQEGALVAIIADEDTITGFLLAGVGEVDLRRRANFLVVDGKTTVRAIEQAFKDFGAREDIAIILISQPIANMIRNAVANHDKVCVVALVCCSVCLSAKCTPSCSGCLGSRRQEWGLWRLAAAPRARFAATHTPMSFSPAFCVGCSLSLPLLSLLRESGISERESLS